MTKTFPEFYKSKLKLEKKLFQNISGVIKAGQFGALPQIKSK